MEENIGFFEEAPGKKSSTRLFGVIVLALLAVFDIIYLIKKFELTWPFVVLNLIFLIAIFTPKYLHKIIERLNMMKNGINNN